MRFKTISARETKKIAAKLAEKILVSPALSLSKGGFVVALQGELGAGKTTFIQGFLRAAGIRKKIISPTFVLMKRFKIQNLNFENVYHIDCYRIHQPKDLLALEIKEIFNNPKNIVLIEWPERIKKHLPKNIIKVKLEHGQRESERIIKYEDHFSRRGRDSNRFKLFIRNG